LDWFNVLIAQTLAQLRTEALHDDALLKSLSEVLNGPAKPDFVGPISVTEMSLGEEFPIFSNCRIVPVDEADVEVKSVGEGTRLLARLDVDLSDAITLGVETKLLLNYPLPVVAVLPVALAVSVVRFSGTVRIVFTVRDIDTDILIQLSISFIPSTSNESDNSEPGSPGPTTLAFSFLPDYRLDLSVRSLLGSRSRLQDVPKIAQLVESRIHDWLEDRCVEPRYQQIVLPSMWPRRKNTRGGETGEEETDETALEERDTRQGHPIAGADTAREQHVHSSMKYEDSLEARIAADGRTLPQQDATEGARRRNLTSKDNTSTEDFTIPGRFQ
jgi:maintenance of mitochondrial morphology protein 1